MSFICYEGIMALSNQGRKEGWTAKYTAFIAS